jgi:hypothetical protein
VAVGWLARRVNTRRQWCTVGMRRIGEGKKMPRAVLSQIIRRVRSVHLECEFMEQRNLNNSALDPLSKHSCLA